MQKRTLLLAVVLGGVALAALWHHAPRTPGGDEGSGVLSAASGPVVYANPPAPQDTLSETEILRRMGRLHHLQASLARAQADRKGDRVERILDRAIGTLDRLVKRPKIVQHPRFQRSFHTLTTAYEARYGVPDTLRVPDG